MDSGHESILAILTENVYSMDNFPNRKSLNIIQKTLLAIQGNCYMDYDVFYSIFRFIFCVTCIYFDQPLPKQAI